MQTTVLAQSFSITANPKKMTVSAGGTFHNFITIKPLNGYALPVFLSVSSPTFSRITISPEVIDTPYSSKPVVVITPTVADTGIHLVIIKGKYGALTRTDTITLNVIIQTQYKTFRTDFLPQDIAFTQDNQPYTLGKTEQNFLAVLHEDEFSFIAPWENFVEDARPDSRHLIAADKTNMIWVGSSGTISQRNDSGWTVYSLDDNQSNSQIIDITIDSSNRVWAVSNPDVPDSITFSSSLKIIENGSYTSADSILKNSLIGERTPLHVVIERIKTDSEGNIWLEAKVLWNDFKNTCEVLRYNGNSWENIFYPSKDTIGTDYYTLTSCLLSMNPTGGVVLTVLYQYNVLHSQFEFIDSQWVESKYSVNEINPVRFDYAGRALSFEDNYLTRWEDTSWVQYEMPFPLRAFGTIHSLEVDYANNIWIAHSGGMVPTGITVYNPNGDSTQQVSVKEEYYTSFYTHSIPNPTQNSTTIYYTLKTESPVSISIYNSLGIEVFKNNLGFENAGDNSEIISTSDLPSGQYYYVLKAGAQQSTQPLIIVR